MSFIPPEQLARAREMDRSRQDLCAKLFAGSG